MIAIIDYGVGNLFSLKSSLKQLGLEAVVTADADTIRKADRLILPGVGAFADAMAKLEATGLVPVMKEEAEKKPLLGAQILAEFLTHALGAQPPDILCIEMIIQQKTGQLTLTGTDGVALIVRVLAEEHIKDKGGVLKAV